MQFHHIEQMYAKAFFNRYEKDAPALSVKYSSFDITNKMWRLFDRKGKYMAFFKEGDGIRLV